jgi:predicted SnoaL-like aldol condensation-catalyzing enzyme
MSPKPESDHRRIVAEFFELIEAGRFKEGLRFFAPDCVQHNPYVHGGMEALVDAMVAANREGRSKYPEAQFAVKQILVDGDLVAAHTQLLSSKSRPGEGGLRQVHLFRFKGDKIVEYWDIAQQVMRDMPNAAGAF